METFYRELKNLRDQQKIDLSEVSNRTKININFLESIEKGDFSFLPHSYVRLFVRAYAIEIGAEPEEILEKLTEYMKETGELPKKVEPIVEDLTPESDSEVLVPPERSPFQFRSTLIKAVILLAILLFAIFIIKKITTKQPPPQVNTNTPLLNNPTSGITADDDLFTNYPEHTRLNTD